MKLGDRDIDMLHRANSNFVGGTMPYYDITERGQAAIG